MTQTETDLSSLIERLEKWIREGQHNLALRALRELNYQKVPRAFRYPLALVAGRILQPLLALKIMNPVIHSESQFDAPPTSKEKLAYTHALTLIGGLDDAKRILLTLDPATEAESLLQLAMIEFRQWNYRESIPLLKRYIASSNLNDYARTVGRLNLAAALIAETRLDEATPVLDEIHSFTKANSHRLLHANGLELAAQVSFQRGDYRHALDLLEPAEAALAEAKSIYYFYVIKWQKLAGCLLRPSSTAALAKAREFRELAITKGYWEVVRDMDLYLAKIASSEVALRAVVWGTPYNSYRKRVERIWNGPISFGDEGEYSIFNKSSLERSVDSNHTPENRNFFRIDLSNAADANVRDLMLHPLCHKLANILTRDRYQPIRIGSLYNELYPNETLDPYQVHARVANVINRTRHFFRERHWPVEIEIQQHDVRLVALADGVIAVKRRQRSVSRSKNFLEATRRLFKGASFTTIEMAEGLGVSRAFCLRLLQEAQKTGLVQVQGTRRDRRYRFTRIRRVA